MLIPLGLFVASAAFVVWRNTQVAVLVDISWSLNTATRIAAGDVPYVDFPLAQAPLHFLVQAVLIRTLGPHFAVQIAYAAVVSGVATATTWWIVRELLGTDTASRAIAVVIAVPLIPLGIYSIYPHPFYDADACLAVLIAIAAILAARRRPSPMRWLLAGALLTIPVWVKQNIGGPFLVLVVAGLTLEALSRRERRDQLLWCLGGTVGTAAVELLLVQATIGLDRYAAGVWTFAVRGRGIHPDLLRAFWDPRVLWPSVLILMLAVAARYLSSRGTAVSAIGTLAALAIVGLAVPGVALSVPELFPPLLIAATILGLVRAVTGRSPFEILIPLVATGTTLGTSMSQGILGSTYGIFPLLALALASIVRDLRWAVRAGSRAAEVTGAVLAGLLLIWGMAYTLSDRRLLYADVHAPGPIVTSSFPSLAGLSARGPYVADLDGILEWIGANVPADEPIAVIPGEDPIFYALARRPALSSVLFIFNDVATPYSAAEIAREADDKSLRWVIVKDRLQLANAPDETELVGLLTARAALVAHVGPYRVYRR